MLGRILRRKSLFALVGAFLMVAQAAEASHDMQYDVTQSSYATNAYPDITSYTYYGSTIPASSETDLPSGYKVSHQQGSGAPWASSFNPSDEEQVGTGTARARWQPFCFSESNLGLTLTWETSIPATAPANTVALVQIEAAGGLFTTDAFLVKQGTNDYKIVVPDMPDSSVCTSTTSGSQSLTIWGDTADGSRVVQNPSTTGTYTFLPSYVDTLNNSHNDSDSVSIV